MRLFITTYQKCGTHQLYPLFAGDAVPVPQLKDQSAHSLEGLPSDLITPVKPTEEGLLETVKSLMNMPERGFGHVPYRPEFAKALQVRPTKVLFGIRDPRDVVVSELENIKKTIRDFNKGGVGLWNWQVPREDMRALIETDDPIAILIEAAFYRWQNWYGWLDHDWVLPVKYEYLRLETNLAVNDIRGFLMDEHGEELIHLLPDAHAMRVRAVPKLGNPTFRKGTPGDWKVWFQDHHIEMGQKFLNPVMERLGYEIDWSLE